MKKLHLFSLILLFAASCKKDNAPSIPDYTVPTTYNFSNFNDSNVLKLLAMADQIAAKINTASNANTIVSAQDLKDMFNNVGNKFADTALRLNSSGLKLSSYCAPGAVTDLNSYFDSVGLESQSTSAAKNGASGRATNLSGARKYLLSANGVFYSQVVRKTFNGGLCAYIIGRYVKDSVANANNTTALPGSGTAMEHYWDEAFGFFAVPIDFPTNTAGLRYFGSYANQVNAGLGCNKSLMDAFLKGRAAISAKDLKTRDAQSDTLVTMFEKTTAASIVQEMKETETNIDAGDAVAAMGTMGEALGFARDLKYYTFSRKITDAQITQLFGYFDSTNPTNPNLYNFITPNSTPTQLKAKTDAIRQFIGQVYGFTPAQLAAQ
ncbi:MAG TPA: DUF4856 domain-containing protein [Puia sp.]